jgi:hypothetical protein
MIDINERFWTHRLGPIAAIALGFAISLSVWGDTAALTISKAIHDWINKAAITVLACKSARIRTTAVPNQIWMHLVKVKPWPSTTSDHAGGSN